MGALQQFESGNQEYRERRFEQIIGTSSALEAVLEQVERVAPTDSTVLIQGETGTGKELIAHAIHNLSSRCGRSFVRLNCAAIHWTCWRASCSATKKVHSPEPLRKRLAASNSPTRAHFSWTKSAISPRHCSRNYFAFCRSKSSNVWEALAPIKWTFGWLPPRTAISPTCQTAGSFAAIFTTG